MEKPLLSIDGKKIKDINLDENIFNCKISEGSIYHAIKNELANLRIGTASVKTRGEVKGSGKKPYKQKGTGRARAGTLQSPIRVGGGIAMGPVPRDYSYKLPKKIKKLAFKSIFSLKAKEDILSIVEDFTIESAKTKDLYKILLNFTKNERTVIILKDDDNNVKRAARNIPWLSFLSFNRLRAHNLYYAKRLIFMDSSLNNLVSFLN